MEEALRAQVSKILGQTVTGVPFLSHGKGATLYLLSTPADPKAYVAKVSTGHSAKADLALEGWMLRFLKDNGLPVPAVLHESAALLLMDYREDRDGTDHQAECHAAELLAALHSHEGPYYGFEKTTPLGNLPQDNTPTESWIDFCRERRVLSPARAALDEGCLDAAMMGRIEKLAGALDGLLDEPEKPALIHGDVWRGNVMCVPGRVTGFLDPAIYYADPEIELAFCTMFGTFGDAFFRTYEEIAPLRPGFRDVRKDLYLLYPYVTHVRIYGGSYLGGVDQILRRFGF